MKAILATFLVLFGFLIESHAQKKVTIGKNINSSSFATISGTIRDFETGERLIGVAVYVPDISKGVVSDENGEFELRITKGQQLIQVSMIGYTIAFYQVTLLGDGKLKVQLKENSTLLDEISITNKAPDQNIRATDIGKQYMTAKAIYELPTFVGEVDILKSITLLPGVSTVGEASSGFNVRGGSTSQNLILLGGATLYNPSHLFGFFSAFNAGVVNGVTLYKGGIPAKYGGRGSSVLDIEYKNGNSQNWGGNASIGTISANVVAEGPIIKDKLSIIVAGRASYADWMLTKVNDPDVRNSSGSYYDVNGRLSYVINEKNKLTYTYYLSGDDFSFASDTSLFWSNQNHVLDWIYSKGDKLSYQLSLVKSRYDYSILNNSAVNQFNLDSRIDNLGLNFSTDFVLFKDNYLNAGFQSTYIEINPGTLVSNSSSSVINNKQVESEKALESGAFLDFNYEVSNSISLSAGVRYNLYYYLGSKTVYDYEPYIPRTVESITDSTYYAKNESIINYNGFEPRFTLRWSLSNSSSIKASYNKMYQYIHLISNTSAIAPTDIWKLSDTFLKPEIVTQYSLGYFKNFIENTLETSAEIYYKETDNVVEYKDGAQLILNDNIETSLLNGIGKSYGLELFLKKKTGTLTGWLSYTYSRSLVQVVGAYDEEQINDGKWYSSNYDKPHDFTVVMMYKINQNWSIAGNFTYSTGRPVTYPAGKIRLEGFIFSYFNERNGLRVPDYHRLDFSITYKMPSRRKIWGGEWKFSIYNVYGRKNAFSVFFRDVQGAPPQPYKLAVLGIPFPSLSYSFKF